MRKRTQAREHALQILYQHEVNPEPIKETLVNFWAMQGGIHDETRAFAETLVLGTLDQAEPIDQAIMKAAENWQLNRMAIVDRNILRLATFELLFMADIPPKVSINEAVNMAKKFSQEDSGKFVNGILDKITHTDDRARQKKI